MLTKYNTIKVFFLILTIWVINIACNTPKMLTTTTATAGKETLPEIKINPVAAAIYRATSEQFVDILHTQIDIEFLWEKRFAKGTVTHKLTPYGLKNIDSLVLDAKSMAIEEVMLNNSKLKFSYNKKLLTIFFNNTLKKGDTLNLLINYIAMPDEKELGGSASIKEDKGLYFINNLKADSFKPIQIWTQGETEANSCWFPTVDKPNNKSSFTINITVPKNLITLSNGLKTKTILNGNLKTDTWEQKQPMSAYLVMMAIGEFYNTNSEWRKKSIDYYVEPSYKNSANKIFDKTKEMLEFFSIKLGVPFPWDKYSQVIVRDYVSGAMENTSASLFGDFIQKNDREFIDGDNQGIVAHEMFHQWFGDLVTCESWSNLFLNEGFATYGEHLWWEHSTTAERAEFYAFADLRRYLEMAKTDDRPIVRFNYTDKEDMFNSITYKKGGRVLHLLRNTLGDTVFFEGIKNYLLQFSFNTAEVHDFRKVMEEVSGKDLTLFFNQWIYNGGHPKIVCHYKKLNDSLLNIEIVQQLDSNKSQFNFPISFHLSNKGNIIKQKFFINKEKQNLIVNINKLNLRDSTLPVIIPDCDHYFLGEIVENKTLSNYATAFFSTTSYFDKARILYHVIPEYGFKEEVNQMLYNALQDDKWSIKQLALNTINNNDFKVQEERLTNILKEIASKDNNSKNRALALEILNKKNFKESAFFEQALKDSSYLVQYYALKVLQKLNSEKAYAFAVENYKDESDNLTAIEAKIIAEKGMLKDTAIFIYLIPRLTSGTRFTLVEEYIKLLKKQDKPILFEQAIKQIAYYAINDDKVKRRVAFIENIKTILAYLDEKKLDYNKDKIKPILQKIHDANKISSKELLEKLKWSE